MLDAQAAMLAEQLFDRHTLVRGGIIQKDNDRAAQMTQQFTQERADLILPDVVIEEQVAEADTMPPRTDGNS